MKQIVVITLIVNVKMSKKLFRPKLGRKWTVTWSEKEKKELVDYFINKFKEKKYDVEWFKQNTLSIEEFLRGGRKININ